MRPRSRKLRTKLEIVNTKYWPVNIALAAQVVTNGSSLRITIPHKQAKAFDIQPGDEVMFSITGVKREQKPIELNESRTIVRKTLEYK